MVHVDLELDPEAVPVRGRIHWAEGQVEFVGWLEFSRLVHELLTATDGTDRSFAGNAITATRSIPSPAREEKR